MRDEAIVKDFIIQEPNGSLSMMSFSADRDRDDVGNIVTLPTNMAGGVKVKAWGKRNDLPFYRDQILSDNNVIPELLSTKRDIALGAGLMCYREVFEDGKKVISYEAIPDEIQEWLDESEFEDKYIDPAFLQWYKHAIIFPEFIANGKGGIASVMCKDAKYMRLQEKVDGVIKGAVYNPRWRMKFDEDEKIAGKAVYIPMYNGTGKQAKFMYVIKDNVFDDGYYPTPAYWGGREWIRVSNAIPIYHEANIENGYSIRFVISYPEGYFLNKYEYESANHSNDVTKIQECLDKERNAKQQFINKMNSLLAGAKNGGRAIFIEKQLNELKTEYVGVEVTPITFDMKDDALLKLYTATNQANISGQGIPATLANIQTEGKLGTGSEKRNDFLFYVITKTPRPRKMILKVFDLVCKLNGWKEKYKGLKWTFEDYSITKLDEDKSGKAPMNEGGTQDDNNSDSETKDTKDAAK